MRKAWLRRDKRGGAEFQTAGNLMVVENSKRGTNKDMGPKDIFEIASNAFPLNICDTSCAWRYFEFCSGDIHFRFYRVSSAATLPAYKAK